MATEAEEDAEEEGPRIPEKTPVRETIGVTARLAWRASPPYTILLAALTFLTALIPPAIVRMGQAMVDGVVQAQTSPLQSRTGLIYTVVALGALTTLQSGLGALQNSRQQILRMRLQIEAESSFVKSVANADAAYFDDPSWHDRVSRASQSQFRINSVFFGGVSILGSSVTVLGMLGILLNLHPILVVFALMAVLLPIPIERKINREVYAMRWDYTPEQRKRNYFRYVLTDPVMAKDLRAFNLEDHFLQRHRKVVGVLHQQLVRLFGKANRIALVVGILSGFSLAAAYGFASSQGLVGEVTPGELTAVVGAIASIVGQMSAISAGLIRIDEDSKYIGDYLDILKLERLLGVPDEPEEVAAPVMQGISYESVTFSYPSVETSALRELDLYIRPGELMALVGDNGAGKTTLVKLLLRFYDPDEGTVRVSGTDLRNADPDQLRQRIGVLFQDPLEISLSVRENLIMGAEHRSGTDDELWEVLERAHIAQLVRDLPDGLDSPVGRMFEGGKDLSGGEWRRLAIARLMYRDADVWVLDEPTSNLDPEAEAKIFSELKANLMGRTGIVISHRFNTVRIADRIAVIEDGRVTEVGTHEELMALAGRYSYLFNLQAVAYE